MSKVADGSRSMPRGPMHGDRPSPPGRRSIESLFAAEGIDPLTGAFAGEHSAHPMMGMRMVAPGDVPRLWEEVAATPRTGTGVAYVHIPFCENHCLFCGFYQNPWRPELGPAYVDAVLAQLRAGADTPAQNSHPLRAVYLGGGTPTALATGDLVRLIEGLRRYLPLAADCEITLEGRVMSFGLDKARAAFDAGVNRVSLGIQTFEETIRRRLGRKTGRREVIAFLDALVREDQGAVVIDLIYGLPGQTLDIFLDDVRAAVAAGVDGLDFYSLKLVPGTPLLTAMDKGKHQPADRKTLGRYFAAGWDLAGDLGLEPISTTHWRRTYRERNVYNATVKTGADCLAFGAGAGASLAGTSFRLAAGLDDYAGRVRAGECLTSAMVRQSSLAPVLDTVRSGMEHGRLDADAVDKTLSSLTGDRFEPLAGPLLCQWAAAGLMTRQRNVWLLTLPGRFWQVAMTSRLIAWIEQEAAPITRPGDHRS
ncbi:heme anaerobic degradation radical SAM methyltransferase ChuW/HutW [Consotaella aegiceratis]|uniref:heme anaerobic degradation radical SAM methyltransferase ChuW/HutW n=1 Tax=Consotaella aegiceratis TaxID=3097961 RepID=UPI002F4056B7